MLRNLGNQIFHSLIHSHLLSPPLFSRILEDDVVLVGIRPE